MSFFTAVAFPWVVDIEKGFTDDPRDAGNWTGGEVSMGALKGTKYGVSAASYPDLDIANLTLETAQGIYKKDFWDVNEGDYLPTPVALSVFDHAVNGGVHHAAILLQRCLGGLIEDGVIGPVTLSELRSHSAIEIAQLYALTRIDDYTRDRSWADYGKGWVNRAIKTAYKAVGV